MLHNTWIALGSNLGDREIMLRLALKAMADAGLTICSVAPFIETAPEGFSSQHPFLNSAVAVRHLYSPEELLLILQQIERKLGRTQKSVNGRYHDRPIDLDILLFDRIVLDSETLSIPHPRMHERRFVLEPLAHIAPELQHPVKHKSILQLLQRL